MEFKKLRSESESFPKLLENKIQSAIENTTNELNQKHEYMTNLKDKETYGRIALLEQTNKSLLEKIAEQKALIEQLSDKSNFANSQVQDIALKAIDGASKMRSIDNVLRKEVEA